MPLEIWTAYILTVLVMMSTPGPSHMLMLSNSASNGFKRSLATGAGDLTANFLQMLAAGLGMSALIMAAPKAFIALKIAGVAYLIWLGLKMLKHSFSEGGVLASSKRTSLKALWLQGFITSASNPKAVVFFAALFPQFISDGLNFWPQFMALSLTYIAIDGTFLCFYGFTSDRLSKVFAKHGLKWVHRIGGVGILIAALLLGLKTLPRTST